MSLSSETTISSINDYLSLISDRNNIQNAGLFEENPENVCHDLG